MNQRYQDVAGFFWLALQRRLLPSTAPIPWADAEIEAQSVPDIRVIDLSLSANQPVDKVMDALRPLAPTVSKTAFRMVGALLHALVEAGSITEAQAANHLCGLSRYDGAAAALGDEVYWIDELFEPWASGPEQTAIRVREYLSRFAEESLPI